MCIMVHDARSRGGLVIRTGEYVTITRLEMARKWLSVVSPSGVCINHLPLHYVMLL